MTTNRRLEHSVTESTHGVRPSSSSSSYWQRLKKGWAFLTGAAQTEPPEAQAQAQPGKALALQQLSSAAAAAEPAVAAAPHTDKPKRKRPPQRKRAADVAPAAAPPPRPADDRRYRRNRPPQGAELLEVYRPPRGNPTAYRDRKRRAAFENIQPQPEPQPARGAKRRRRQEAPTDRRRRPRKAQPKAAAPKTTQKTYKVEDAAKKGNIDKLQLTPTVDLTRLHLGSVQMGEDLARPSTSGQQQQQQQQDATTASSSTAQQQDTTTALQDQALVEPSASTTYDLQNTTALGQTTPAPPLASGGRPTDDTSDGPETDGDEKTDDEDDVPDGQTGLFRIIFGGEAEVYLPD